MLDREFTATAYIIQDQQVLLIWHKKHAKWLPPGGHVEKGETPCETVIREVKEETGLQVEIIPQENVWVSTPVAHSLHRPYLVLLETLPSYQSQEAHQHIDFIYLTRPVGGTIAPQKGESTQIQWFNISQVRELKAGEEIFTDTQEILEHLLQRDYATVS